MQEKKIVNIPSLISDYYTLAPNPDDKTQQVAFGTSGHRGSSALHSFNEAHILAIAQAVYEHRTAEKIPGPLYLGADTHALSEPSMRTCVEVLAANGVELILQKDFAPTPTPVISRAILEHNRTPGKKTADG
ncbi:MAG: phosphoglucomutase, alpha-D-glucose phosphate-specific, partial [Synergistaceae bacterium]|nr:phosphoglucomutase, alpha-D-glucose phosphate-specific [Synergistaceae bacterium]